MTARARLQCLRPRLAPAAQRAIPLVDNRIRGRRGVERRAGWLKRNPLCVGCMAEGRVTIGQEIDHVIPLFMGGADNETNFATLCIPHHAAKTARERKAADG